MSVDIIKTKVEEAQKRHHFSIEELIRSKLPEDTLVASCEWVPNEYIRGANTLCYQGEPIISIFPVEMKEERDGESFQIIIEQKYFDHTNAQKE